MFQKKKGAGMKIKGRFDKIYEIKKSPSMVYFGLYVPGMVDDDIQEDGCLKCSGIIPKYEKGTWLTVEGEKIKEETEERNIFQVSAVYLLTETEKMSRDFLKRVAKELEDDYELKLSPTGIKKIAEACDQDVVKFFETREMETAVRELTEKCKRIKKETLEQCVHTIYRRIGEYDVVKYLASFDCPMEASLTLVERYGKFAVQQLKEHPYQIGYYAGLDFFMRDKIARAEQKQPLDEERIKALLYTALNDILKSSGSTYVFYPELKERVNQMVEKSSWPEIALTDTHLILTMGEMNNLVLEKTKDGVRIYRKCFFQYESSITKDLCRLNERILDETFNPDEIPDIERKLGITYDIHQKNALDVLKTSGVKIITGGPGTGKTTVVNGIIELYKRMHPGKRILLCAPTGRAAQKMSEVTGMESFTICRALEFRPFGDGEMRHKDKDSPIEASLLILDEMSMVDEEIFSLFLDAVKTGSTVILIGDENQLQSVCSGNVLHDLIRTEKFEMHRFKKVFRQKNGNTIMDNSYKVLDGQLDLEKNALFQIHRYWKEETAIQDILTEFEHSYDPKEISKVQILTATRIGMSGTIELNKKIADVFNKDKEEEDFFFSRGYVYHVGDKVIFSRNNYDKGYYNGDIGIILQINRNGFSVGLGEDIIRVSGKSLMEVSPAFAITVHKSQGSEAGEILILLSDEYKSMMTKNLLFTAITRAKKKVQIYYVNDAFSSCIKTRQQERKTGLEEKIKGVRREILNG